jgi:hypothetical protein
VAPVIWGCADDTRTNDPHSVMQKIIKIVAEITLSFIFIPPVDC